LEHTEVRFIITKIDVDRVGMTGLLQIITAYQSIAVRERANRVIGRNACRLWDVDAPARGLQREVEDALARRAGGRK
jgi:hypothetical protein